MGCLFSNPKPKITDAGLIQRGDMDLKPVHSPPPENKVSPSAERPAPKPAERPEPAHTVDQPKPAPIQQTLNQTPEEPPKASSGPIAIKNENAEAFGLLLCGSGESGKTTFTRQLRLKYLNGFQDEEKSGFVSTIRGNLIETMQSLLVWLDHNSMAVSDENEENSALIASIDPFECEYNEEIYDALNDLWADEQIQKAFAHKDETQIPDHMQYFFDKLDQVSAQDYIPTDEDVLRARIRTIGITSVTFDMDSAIIRIYDVGGQRNERSKWEKVMNEVGGVIYCVSFSEFDKPMFEDPSILRINDSIQIFEEITHRDQFNSAPFFLICNKFDIFKEKVTSTDCFVKTFPEYTGNPHDPEECAQYIIDKFLSVAGENPNRPINVRKIVALNAQDVVDATSFICKFISEKYFE
jgi:GTPase SAR1 family protein